MKTIIVAEILLLAPRAEALLINAIYDASVAGAPAGFIPGFTEAIHFYQNTSLPVVDPTGSVPFFLSTAQARALSLASVHPLDGNVGFQSNTTWTFDPNTTPFFPLVQHCRDITALDAIGYNRAAVPESGSLALLSTGLLGLGFLRAALVFWMKG